MYSWWFLGVIVCLLVVPFLIAQTMRRIVVPMRVALRQRVAVRPTFELTRAEQLTPEMREFIGRAVRQFAAEDFEAAANFYVADAVTNVRGASIVRATEVLLVNRATNDTALIMSGLATTRRLSFYVVRSEFADGTRMTTGAGHSSSTLPPDRADQPVVASWIKDARVLCEFHRRRLRARGWSDRARVAPAPGTELDHAHRNWDREMSRHAGLGYKRLDDDGKYWRFTWKGAILTTWRINEPIRSWRQKARDRRARRAWDEVGMGDWRPPAEPRPAAIPVQAVAAPAGAATVPPPLPGRPFASHAPLPPPPPGPPLAPPAAVHPAPPASGLTYETALGFGEVRTEWSGSALVIRVGGLTRGQYLARNWYVLIWPCLLLLLIGLSLLGIWRYYLLVSRIAGRPAPLPRLPWLTLLFWTVLLALDLTRLARGLRRSRGTTTLLASHDGLTFRNAPSTNAPDGQVPRDELESLNVIAAEVGLFKRTYHLIAHVRGRSRRQVLAAGPDKQAMEFAKGAVAQGLGIAGV